jgi:hypothetical protein
MYLRSMKNLTLFLLLFCFISAFAQGQSSATKQKPKFDSSVSELKTELTEDDMPVDTSPVYRKYNPAIPQYYHTSENISDRIYEIPEALMIDSTIVDPHYMNWFAPNHVGAVDMMKSPKGVLNLTLKNEYRGDLQKILESKLLSITDIKNIYLDKANKNKQVIYLLNDDMLTDTANIKIPEICLLHVSIAKASETPYFKTAMPNILIMMISTKYASSKPYHPPMILR